MKSFWQWAETIRAERPMVQDDHSVVKSPHLFDVFQKIKDGKPLRGMSLGDIQAAIDSLNRLLGHSFGRIVFDPYTMKASFSDHDAFDL